MLSVLDVVYNHHARYSADFRGVLLSEHCCICEGSIDIYSCRYLVMY